MDLFMFIDIETIAVERELAAASDLPEYASGRSPFLVGIMHRRADVIAVLILAAELEWEF